MVETEIERVQRQYEDTKAWFAGGCEGRDPYWEHMAEHFAAMEASKLPWWRKLSSFIRTQYD